MKYMGSKSRIAKDIAPILIKYLTEEKSYIEPFLGGANMMCHIKHHKRMGFDKNNYLIAMWKFLCDGDISVFPTEITKETYSVFRDKFNEAKFNGDGNTFEEALIGWYGFMGSFNGRFFDGGYSGHNVNGRDYIGEQIRNTLSQVDDLRGVYFDSADYRDIIIPNNSIVYCDPPYKGTKQYLISKDFCYTQFWEWCRSETYKGNDVLVSEYEAPDDFICIWHKEVTNALNTKNTYKPTESLFVHKNIADKYLY